MKIASEAVAPISDSFWPGRRVLVTGHTGFKGRWLTVWLRHLGAEVTGFSRRSSDDPDVRTERLPTRPVDDEPVADRDVHRHPNRPARRAAVASASTSYGTASVSTTP